MATELRYVIKSGFNRLRLTKYKLDICEEDYYSTEAEI